MQIFRRNESSTIPKFGTGGQEPQSRSLKIVELYPKGDWGGRNARFGPIFRTPTAQACRIRPGKPTQQLLKSNSLKESRRERGEDERKSHKEANVCPLAVFALKTR